MYRTKYFILKELVHPVTYKRFGQLSWKFLNADALRGLDLSRKLFGPLTVNDWCWGGDFVDSGYRQADSNTGSEWSAHRRGCGFDPKSKRYTGKQMRRMLRDKKYWIKMRGFEPKDIGIVNYMVQCNNWEIWTTAFFLCINEVELGTTTWLHIARTNRKQFKWVSP